jgi:hypothetical protein
MTTGPVLARRTSWGRAAYGPVMLRAAARGPLALVVAATLGLAACGSDDQPSAASEPTKAAASQAVAGAAISPVARTPELDAIGVIGHSGATGADSAPDGSDVVANSWATGTNPDVESVYQRLLADHPALEGHGWNEAIDGSDVSSLMGQAEALMAEDPVPDIVLVQSIDNDIRCDGTDEQNYDPFEQSVREVVGYLEQADPGVKLFFVDVWGSAQEYDDAVSTLPHGIDHITNTGPCAAYTPDGRRHTDREAYLQQVVDAYFARLEKVCAEVEGCATDEEALQDFGLEPHDLTPDMNHLMPSGQAKMAAIVWDALPADWKGD